MHIKSVQTHIHAPMYVFMYVCIYIYTHTPCVCPLVPYQMLEAGVQEALQRIKGMRGACLQRGGGHGIAPGEPIYVCVCVCKHGKCMQIYIYIYIHIHICMYVYVHTYTHNISSRVEKPHVCGIFN